jgi:hypothetical protein
MKGREYEIQKMLVNYLESNCPDIQYRCDLGGLYLGTGLALKVSRLQKTRAWPDLFIAHPTCFYAGLFIEVKESLDILFTKDGKWREGKSYQHIYEQKDMLEILRGDGYCAEFGCGFEHCRDLIDWYLGLPLPTFLSPLEFPDRIR